MIGVLTYNVPHRKTFDVLCLLKAHGYQDVIVYASPLYYVKTFFPIYRHRPSVNYVPDPEEFCKNMGYQYLEGPLENFDIPKDQVLLICGAGILQEKFLLSHKIINSHPGYIPYCRGLDSYKWAIYEGKPVGVTTHLLGEYVDAGEIIERRLVPIFFNDTFHSVAQRVYEYEVAMLVEAIPKVDEVHEFISPESYPLHKRMPHSMETRLMERFDKMVKNVPI